MRTFIRNFGLVLLISFAVLFGQSVIGQSVLNPADPIVTYSSANPPAQPAWGTIGKWVRTKRLSWNTDSYKAYIYKGMCFRLKFPKTYNPTAVDGKKYPIIVFFHGRGEAGTIYDNEFSLLHGGENFRNKVDNGTFDGYIFVAQSTGGYWGEPPFTYVREIMDYMITNNKLDPFRIIDNGLSSGGAGTWDMAIANQSYMAAVLPMSASSTDYQQASVINKLKYTPMWIFQGGLDGAPDPYTTEQVRDDFLAAGANFKYTLYPDLGHGTWNRAWSEADFFPYCNRAYQSNPWPLFARTEFCPGDPINVTIGLVPGMQAYQWRRNGVALPNTGNTIQATSLGIYDARVQRNGVWSEWSRIPVEIKLKAAPVIPTITVDPTPLQSKVLPALDTTTGVTLEVPNTYASYIWQRVGNGTTLSTTNRLFATTPGDYRVQVTEQFGCSSDFTTPFTVVNANGPNKPDPASGLTITTLSKTSLQLDWNDNPAPQFNETNFEVYQATNPAGPYKLIAITNADVLTYNATGLNSGSKYHFKVRAVNGTGAAAASNIANGTTDSDVTPPSAPSNLQVTGTGKSTVSLAWGASTDDVGIVGYDIYVNGVKEYSSTTTSFTVGNLQAGPAYNFAVKGRDFAGNSSAFSNQVTARLSVTGVNYKQYVGTWTALPDFNTLNPVAQGIMSNFSITPRTQNDNFAFLWEGYLIVEQSGTYNFRTTSNEGSRLWLGALNGSTSPYSFAGAPIVNNDGIHSSQTVTSANITLQVGRYPIAVAFFDATGSESMTVQWRRNSGSYGSIPNDQLEFSALPVATGSAPAAPTNLVATAVSYKQINLTWTDASNNETGFEIWRATGSGAFLPIGISAPNTNSYQDKKQLSAGTAYSYRIRAIGQYGESAFAPQNLAQANWKFDNNYNDASINGRTLDPNNSPTFNSGDKMEGTHSVDLNGSDEDIDVPTNSGDYLRGGYNVKTVAFWMRADATTGDKVIFDFGGSDDGLAMRLDGNVLHAGIASNNTRRTLTTPYNFTGWKFVTLVYSTNTLRLYIDSAEVASNTNLGFSSVGTTSDDSRIGDNSNVTALNAGSNQFDGRLDNFAIYGSALTLNDIKAIMLGTYGTATATTQAAPGVPSTPANFLATGISSSKINLTWNDATNETGYELFRSGNTNGNYILFATLPANATSYQDTGLFANAVFYYKVRGKNEGGVSGFSNEDSARAINNPPTVTPIATQYMRYGTTLNLNVTATDSDPEIVTLSVIAGLPSFATFTPGANGTGVISFNPTQSSDQGTYAGITVKAVDQHNGESTTTFTLIVNNNFNPDVNNVSNVTLNEKATAQVNLSASDPNSDPLTWSFIGLPDFANVVPSGNTAQINLTPGYSDAGVYNVKVKVDDGQNGSDTTSFVITVNNVNPNKKTYIDFTNGAITSPAPWNNTSRLPALNANWPNLLDETGAAGTIGLRITSDWANMGYGDGTNDYGSVTGNNSGVFPDNVQRTNYFCNQNSQSFEIYGLNPSMKYNLTISGSRGSVADDRTSIYTVNGTPYSLQTANNTANAVIVTGVTPNASGIITLGLSKPASSPFAYISGLIIENVFDDQTVPVRPRNLSAQFANNQIGLTWTAAAYNATAYQVYRATSLAGPYTLLNPGANNPTQSSHSDGNISQNSTYYYYVRAINSYGSSPSSDTVSVAIPNVAPVLAAISNVSVNAGQTVNINVTATDAVGDVITLEASGLPAFATFTPGANGTGVISITPATSDLGSYENISITASDNHNGSSLRTFSIVVNYANTKNVYVQFNDGSAAQPAQGSPWNSMNALPTAGRTLNNLLDESGNNTGFGLRLVEAWDGANNLGTNTGNNSGVYPDRVLQSFYYDGTASAKHITLSGFSTANKYNITLFGTRGGVNDANRITLYTIGGVTKQLDCANNTQNTVSFTGITPDANGQIQVTIQKEANAFYGYLNSIVIQYPFDTTFYAPVNVRATGISKTQIKVDWVKNYAGTTSFEIYRSTASNGTYNLLTTVPSTQTTYTNGGLAPGQSFFYKIKAIAGARQSALSAYAGATTVAYAIDLNFNDGVSNPNQGGNWNNTGVIFNDPGFVLPNLINQQGFATGMNFQFDGEWTGYNIYGQVTGNNSGIYPDNVMAGFFYVNFGDTARWRFTGLNLTSTYNFRFFGSRLSPTGGPVTTSYRIGNEIVVLDATDNTQNTVQITGIKPDSTGTVYVTMYTTAGRGYINAMTIEGAPSASETITPPFETGRMAGGNKAAEEGKNPTPTVETTTALQITQEAVNENKVRLFPNPFVDDIVLDLAMQKPGALRITVTDIIGRVVLTRELANIPQGYVQRSVELNAGNWKPGTYLMRIDGLGDKPQVFKIVKL